MKKRTGLALLLVLLLALSGCTLAEEAQAQEIRLYDISDMDFSFTDRERSGDSDAENACRITGENGKISVDGGGARLSGAGVSIEDEGCYILSGTFENAMITVAVPDDEKVQLVLDNLVLTNESGPAIYVRAADKVFITAKEGTVNRISDGSAYEFSDDDKDIDGAVYSRADLVLNGSGALIVEGKNKHGVVSKDELVIANCALEVTAKKLGLSGKDCVKILGGSIRVEAGTDGVRSDNDEKADRGYVYLENTKLRIAAAHDGIQAETVLRSVASALEVSSGGGSEALLDEGDDSCKGLKAGQDVLLEGGSVAIDSRDDSIHANGNAAFYGSDLVLSSGDDGIHADAGVLVSGGSIDIRKSYEGIEGSEIRISGGSISIRASDDGVNVAGGADSSGMGERPGRGKFEAADGSLVISGGTIWVDAYGDGLDSNGSIEIRGGVTLVCGPTNGGNGALDYAASASVCGGTLIAVGSSGMAEGFSAAENQGAYFSNISPQEAGTSIALCDAEGNVIAGFTPIKDYSSVVFTAPGLQVGGSYRLIAGAELTEADENGFAGSGGLVGGTELSAFEMTDELLNSGSGMGGGPGKHSGRKGFGGGRGFRDDFPSGIPEGEVEGGAPTPPEGFEGMTPPEGFEGVTPPEGFEGMTPPEDASFDRKRQE